MAADRPVDSASFPIASPPPNRSTTPQSIRDASSQVIVNLRARQLIGIRNSSSAPRIAAIDSGKMRLYCRVTACVSPNQRLRIPGSTHKNTVSENAMITLRSPIVIRPRRWSSFETARTDSGLKRMCRARGSRSQPMTNSIITTMTGTPIDIQPANVIGNAGGLAQVRDANQVRRRADGRAHAADGRREGGREHHRHRILLKRPVVLALAPELREHGESEREHHRGGGRVAHPHRENAGDARVHGDEPESAGAHVLGCQRA